MGGRLLIVEDDSSLNQMLALHFEDQGYTVSSAYTCREGLERVRAEATDLMLLDQYLPDGTGIELLEALRREEPDLPIIMMTGMHDLDLTIEAIKKGAHDFVHKPIKTEELEHVVARVLKTRRLAREVAALQTEPRHPTSTGELIGRCDAMLQVSKEIALTAESNASVLITGESGTGKEVVARLIHLHSNRSGPFVPLNCAAIVDTLLESELFGHEKGAFTGAIARKLGKFELAQDGTLFLDELGELASPLQAKLLRVLQEGTFERVGGVQQIRSNARIIAATNRNLEKEVQEKRFREDLLYRLNVVSIHLPPLRERKEDIPLLAEALMDKIAQAIHREPLRLSSEAQELLMAHSWPGNVRELENVLTQAMVHAREAVLIPELLSLRSDDSQHAITNPQSPEAVFEPLTLDEVEDRHIQQVLRHTGGHKGQACEILRISRPALDRKIKRYNLTVPRTDR